MKFASPPKRGMFCDVSRCRPHFQAGAWTKHGPDCLTQKLMAKKLETLYSKGLISRNMFMRELGNLGV